MPVEERLALLENERAIEQLKYRYARCCDGGYDLAGLRALFMPDGTWSANGYGTYRGHEAICDFFAELSKSIVTVLHYVSTPTIVLAPDGRSAEGRFYLHCLSRVRRKASPDTVDFFVQMGIYTDTFIRTTEGWRFASLNVDVLHTERLGA